MGERSRTYTWSEPVPFSGSGSGLAYLQAIVDGSVPQPPIGATLGFALVEVGAGRRSGDPRRPLGRDGEARVEDPSGRLYAHGTSTLLVLGPRPEDAP